MIRAEFWIPGTLPGWNDLLTMKSRTNKNTGWNQYNARKKSCQDKIALLARSAGLPRFPGGVHVWYDFREPTRRRDPSNFAGGAIKLIEDALVREGILQGDGWEHMKSIQLVWTHSKENPGIRVTILGDEA